MECRLSTGWAPFLGRLFISFIFIFSGFGKIIAFSSATSMLSAHGVVGPLALYIGVALLLEILGGLLILLGWHTRVGCYILMLFLLPTTLIMHAFWKLQGVEQMNQMAHFLKNVAIFGSLLILSSFGPGRWSMDALLCCKGKDRCKEKPEKSCCSK